MEKRTANQEGKELTMLAVTALVEQNSIESYVEHLLAFHEAGGITLDNPEAVRAALEAYQAHGRMRKALGR
jgi:hypothetical protein